VTGRILVVEDDIALQLAVAEALSRARYQVTAVGDGAAAVRELKQSGFDVMLLDIGLPFVDGWHILAGLGPQSMPSVIVISARGSERDKVRALDMGADDYLAKPFGTGELMARVRAVLRRAQRVSTPGVVARCAGVAVDLGSGAVFKDGVEVGLSPTEYGLLAELASHAGQVLTHRTLLQRVWGPDYGDERNYLRTFVQRLRAKLENHGDPRVIVTVGSRGYRFGPPPQA
jgi:two-component system KDP operon response regulator KdpE